MRTPPGPSRPRDARRGRADPVAAQVGAARCTALPATTVPADPKAPVSYFAPSVSD